IIGCWIEDVAAIGVDRQRANAGYRCRVAGCMNGGIAGDGEALNRERIPIHIGIAVKHAVRRTNGQRGVFVGRSDLIISDGAMIDANEVTTANGRSVDLDREVSRAVAVGVGEDDAVLDPDLVGTVTAVIAPVQLVRSSTGEASKSAEVELVAFA